MVGGVATWPVVVPLETGVYVIRDADVVPRWIAVTSKDVDDTLFDTVHASAERTVQASMEVPCFADARRQGCRIQNATPYAGWKILQVRVGAALLIRAVLSASALRGYGETAFAGHLPRVTRQVAELTLTQAAWPELVVSERRQPAWP